MLKMEPVSVSIVTKKIVQENLEGKTNQQKILETKMKAEYKLKKERWKREMENQETPKSQRNQGNNILKLFQRTFQKLHVVNSILTEFNLLQALDLLCPLPVLLPPYVFSFSSAGFLSKQNLTGPARFLAFLCWSSSPRIFALHSFLLSPSSHLPDCHGWIFSPPMDGSSPSPNVWIFSPPSPMGGSSPPYGWILSPPIGGSSPLLWMDLLPSCSCSCKARL